MNFKSDFGDISEKLRKNSTKKIILGINEFSLLIVFCACNLVILYDFWLVSAMPTVKVSVNGQVVTVIYSTNCLLIDICWFQD